MAPSDGATKPKRLSLTSRQLSSSSIGQLSPNEALLSSSAQKHKAQRRVGLGRAGPRIPSYSKNVNKLTKLTPTHGVEEPLKSPRHAHIKRNSSTVHLARETTSAHLKRNHSETSLKRNRSSGQLTKLTRASSSKNITKLGKGDGKSKRSSAQIMKEHDALHPTVRFDLGDDDAQDDEWTEDGSTSQSPATTRSNSVKNSTVLGPENISNSLAGSAPTKMRTLSYPARSDTSEADSCDSETASVHERASTNSKVLDADTITSRLLNRNVSFNAAPKLSDISATATPEGQQSQSLSHSQSSLNNEGPGSDNVSRFINSGGPGSGTSRESSFLPRHEPHSRRPSQGETISRSKPVSEIAETPAQTSSPKDAITLAAEHPSRTQQRMWLERASIENETQQLRAAQLGRNGRTRLTSAGSHLHTESDGTLSAGLQHQRIADLSASYQVIRRYRNPMAEAIRRLRVADAAGNEQRRQPGVRGVGKSQAAGSGHDRVGLTAQGLKDGKALQRANGDGRKAKATFEGLQAGKDERGQENRHSWNADGTSDATRTPSEDARELCRRIWERPALAAGGD